jgi:tRNA-binding protein
MISWEDFNKIDLRAGTIVKSELFEGTKKPTVGLWIDFGPNWGIKKVESPNYEALRWFGINWKTSHFRNQFPPKQIANFISEALVTPDENGDVILSTFDKTVPNRGKLF